jgi:eukaryotic-like serine/threonine-protein kinase
MGAEGRPFVGRLLPGSRVDRYQILGAIGRGGMGEVYAAYHPDLDRRIALKVVHESGAGAPEKRARLLREARAIARLSHPNVVTVYDAGTFGDRVYIAMEFIDGDTTDAWLRAEPRGWREILDVFMAAGRGLAAAHAAGIVHRDFKPQNVMIGRDGSVRVMDFGLARLAEEPADPSDARGTDRARAGQATISKAGALVGTLAYMAPEQFRGEAIDPRADQFSFCVALHEALFGLRPAVAHLADPGAATNAASARATMVPAWLRAVVGRGIADDRNGRFASMEDLIGALVKGRVRPRRRAVGAIVALTIALVTLGGWRVIRAARITCAVPTERLAAVWSGHDDGRREAIHSGFVASGQPNAETSWLRFSKILDNYVNEWSTMYVATCEATHVRGEQSGEMLDLRMICLSENLDEVRALVDVLVGARTAPISRALTAAQGLSNISRCADQTTLRSSLPLPRDSGTLAEVQALRGRFRDVRSLVDLGNLHAASKRAAELRPQVEALGFKPLLAELLELIGFGTLQFEAANAEPRLEAAFFAAESCGDDLTAAKASTHLSYAVGYRLRRPDEGERWARISESILNRMGAGHERLRAWWATNYSAVLASTGDTATALGLIQEAVELKTRVLGPDHPDIAISLSNQAFLQARAGQLQDALHSIDRALDISAKSGDPDASVFANLHNNRGDVLAAVGRYSDAEREFAAALNKLRAETPTDYENLSQALHGIGVVRFAQGRTAAAIPFLEQALAIRERHEIEDRLTADTSFILARALWASASERHRARGLAMAARRMFAGRNLRKEEQSVRTWLARPLARL